MFDYLLNIKGQIHSFQRESIEGGSGSSESKSEYSEVSEIQTQLKIEA